MSDTTPRPTSAAHPTKQQLDDLIELMQQMLALPVNPGDADAGPTLVSPEPSEPRPPEPTPPSTLTTAFQERVVPPPEPVRDTEDPPADMVMRFPHPRPTARPPEIARSSRLDIDEPVLPLQGRRAVFPVVARPRTARLLAPLVWTNLVFDRWVLRLGRPGRWLRGQRGRMALGVLGLLFLVAALAWLILDGMGWTW